MKISENCIVEIELELRDEAGELALTTDDEGPIEYLHGGDDLPLPGLETALDGAEVGTELEIKLEADDAFGAYDYELLVSVPRSEFPPDAEIVPGDIIPVEIEADDGENLGDKEMVVESISADAIVLDANHPLAGQSVNCKTKVLSVRAATEDELAGIFEGEDNGGEDGDGQ